MLTEREIDELRAIAERLREQEASEVGYGYFPGGDPRDFSPDEESCTEKEIAAWKRACELVDQGKVKTVDGRTTSRSTTTLASALGGSRVRRLAWGRTRSGTARSTSSRTSSTRGSMRLGKLRKGTDDD